MILNMISGGGSTGCVLTVTAPAGAVVTASKDGRTLTKTAASGTAVFRGMEGGEWSVACTDGEQTSVPQTVTVKNDYEAELTFFAATIHVTYPEGSVCTATDGVTTLTAPDSSGSWSCVVPNAGTWTVSCTDGNSSDAEVVSIATDGQTASAELLYRTYLFREGYGAIAELDTTTWGSASVSVGTDYISIPRVDNQSGVFTQNKVDLTGYKTVYFISIVASQHSSPNSYGYRFGAFDSNGLSTYASNNNIACVIPTANASRKQYSVDVSQINGSYYVGAKGSDSSVKIYDIWLE